MTPAPLVFVSGIGPGATGTGALMIGLMAEAAAGAPAEFIVKEKTPRKRGWARLQKFNPFRIVCYFFSHVSFPRRVLRAARSGKELILLHPQTIGFPLFRQVVEARPHVWMYVLDAFVFCRRSYNCLPGETGPCLRCLGNDGKAAVAHGCSDWFGAGSFHQQFREWVASGRLRLMAQCDSHARLLRAHFGPGAIVKVVPLSVPDIAVPAIAPTRPSRARPLAVFHGSCQPAKGVAHVIALAAEMPDWDFLVPSDPKEYRKHFGTTEGLPGNLQFRRLSWSEGLADAVATADAVLCPSIWSATVEGAVLKSLAHNGLVMVTTHDSSFGSELPVDARLDLDPADLRGTAARLRAVHADPAQAEAIRAAARAYAENYARGCHGMLAAIGTACRTSA
jgi:glycosyltransferase involved in cell wall biosynthesis